QLSCGDMTGLAPWPVTLSLGYGPDMPGIVIVGAGFGGIGMGMALKQGFSFEYWARTRRASRADYAVTAVSPEP
ncbi:MAG: hypothetical protein ACRDOH_35895, partial [Streptosporangiaceae bacterium]